MHKDFYVFRHGETDLNLQKRWQGSGMDFDLNENGVAQAQGLVKKLQDKKIEKIYSSPLIRAKHTAEVVAQELNIPMEVRSDLRECFYGDAEGELIVNLQTYFPDIVNNWSNPNFWDIRFPNGESKKEALDRVLAEIQRLKSLPYTVMGIAIHGGTMGAMLNFFDVPFEKLQNCACFHLVCEGDHLAIEGDIF